MHFALGCQTLRKHFSGAFIHNVNLKQGQRMKMQLYRQVKMPHTYIEVFVQVV